MNQTSEGRRETAEKTRHQLGEELKGRPLTFIQVAMQIVGIKSGPVEAKSMRERGNTGKGGNESLARCFGRGLAHKAKEAGCQTKNLSTEYGVPASK